MLCTGRQIICEARVFTECIYQVLLLMILNTDHEQRVVLQPLLYQIKILTLVFKLTVNPFIPILVNWIRQRNRNSQYNEIF